MCTPPSFSAMFSKGDNFHDFPVVTRLPGGRNEVFCQRKESAPIGPNPFPIENYGRQK